MEIGSDIVVALDCVDAREAFDERAFFPRVDLLAGFFAVEGANWKKEQPAERR